MKRSEILGKAALTNQSPGGASESPRQFDFFALAGRQFCKKLALRIISSLYCTIIPARLMSAAFQPKAVGRGKNLP
jgi:hypothetical protein